jgi:hypothetical protein
MIQLSEQATSAGTSFQWTAVSAIVASIALLVSLFVSHLQRRDRREERRSARRTTAEHVSGWVDIGYSPSDGEAMYDLHVVVNIRNTGKQPVYDVAPQIMATVLDADGNTRLLALGHLGAPPVIPVLPPDAHGQWPVTQQVVLRDVDLSLLRVNLSFRDPANVLWDRDHRGLLKEATRTTPRFEDANEDEMVQQIGEISPANPLAVAGAFLSTITSDEGFNPQDVLSLCSERSVASNSWGDFIEVSENLKNRRIGTYVEQPVPEIAYVKFLADQYKSIQVKGDGHVVIPATFMTLIFEDDAWRVHSLGPKVRPDQLSKHKPTRRRRRSLS